MDISLPKALERLSTAIDDVHKAFGAPGDYGYDTEKGGALFRMLNAQVAVAAARVGIVDDIAEAYVAGRTPPALQEAFKSYWERNRDTFKGTRLQALIVVTDTRSDLPEAERVYGLRFIANELINVAAIAVMALKESQGEPFSPARFAIVAHEIAAEALASVTKPGKPAELLDAAEKIGWALRNPDNPEAAGFVEQIARAADEPAQA
jgi:hypothetical protein